MASRVTIILPAVLAGILIGAVMMLVVAPPQSGTTVPSHTLTTATGCEDADDPRGWIGQIPNADHRAVYLTNFSYPHTAPDVEILGELDEPEPNDWVLAITVTPQTSEKEALSDCQPRSVINAAVALPPAAESFTISIEGETITVVDTTGQSPRFSYLEK